MATETEIKYISFNKQELIDYLELSFTTGFVYPKPYVLSFDLVTKTFVFFQDPEDGETLAKKYTMTFQELIDNILSDYDPLITINDISNFTNNDSSKITVEY